MTREQKRNIKDMVLELLNVCNSTKEENAKVLNELYIEFPKLGGLVIMLEYYKLIDVDDDILRKSLSICPSMEDGLYDAYLEICQSLWLKKANKEIKSIIKELEGEPI